MSGYKLTLNVQGTVEDVPPLAADKNPVDDIGEVRTKKFAFKKSDPAKELDFSNDKLAFLFVNATRFKFKECSGKEKPGITLSTKEDADKKTKSAIDAIDSPRLYVSRPLQELSLGKLSVSANPMLFDATKPDEEVLVTLTYGLKETTPEKPATPDKPGAGKPVYKDEEKE